MIRTNRRSHALATALVIAIDALATGGCAGANEMSIVFEVPATWSAGTKPKDHPEILGIWLAPAVAASGFRENISIVRYRLDTSLKAFIIGSLDDYQIRSPQLHFVSRKANEHCAPGTSELVRETDVYSNGDRIDGTQVFTKSGDNVFITTYSHNASDPPNPLATKVVERTCAAAT